MSESKPEFWDHRIRVWDEVKAKREAERNALPDVPITVTLPSGDKKEALKGKTTPYDIALSISKGLAKQCVVAKVDDNMWDLHRPLEGDCSLVLYKIDTPEANNVFWHSSSHILGQSLEYNFSCLLTKGPAIDKGFFYDFRLPEGREAIKKEDYEKIEAFVSNIIKEGQPFERLALTKDEALEMFKYNKYKTELISSKVSENGWTSAYRCGPLIDLCKGPHIPNTNLVKGFKVYNNSSSYWKNDSNNDSLQRVYGISFPSEKQLNDWIRLQEELEKRDHRNIGKEQELFFFHPLSPGSCFFLPKGALIYNKLIEYIRKQYRKRGFTEVLSPNVYNKELWETSGHWENYKDNMFCFECDKQLWALKPMNCPGHCLMYKSKSRSYRDLPLRFAEFGVLHRNEVHGSLTGLTRVRRFQQDDCHIFCMPEQIEQEISSNLEFLREVYGVFGFTFSLALSTRPKDKFLGTVEMWDQAENALKNVLDKFGSPWSIKEGDGAFYGPKIDISVQDAMERNHQCATVQLDFNLPIRFELEFDSEVEGEKRRPVIVHRAIYGSLERFIAILCEHTAGKWPFWISPRQIMICTVTSSVENYAQMVRQRLHDEGFETEIDTGDKTIMKKVRQYQLAQYNYILVIGKEEESEEAVNVRIRDEKKERGKISVNDLIAELKELVRQFK